MDLEVKEMWDEKGGGGKGIVWLSLHFVDVSCTRKRGVMN